MLSPTSKLIVYLFYLLLLTAGLVAETGARTMLDTLDYRVRVSVWLEDAELPWALEFIDADTALVTELSGNLLVVEKGRRPARPVAGTPRVLHRGQGGLLDVALDPDYAVNGWVYLAYSHGLPGKGAMTRVVRGRIRDNTWVDQQVLFEARPEHYERTSHHYGSRLEFDRNGLLYFSVGDRGRAEQAQDITRPNGKVHRINADGTIPVSNPFIQSPGAYPSIYSYGVRNPQGLARHPTTGDIWEAEHGPKGGDELNLIRSGRNFGWPEITYGIDYSGQPVSAAVSKPGMEQPILYWRPSIAVCAIEFYTGALFPKWKNHLLVTALKYQELRLLTVVENRILHQEVILKGLGRVRDVKTGPDGAIYAVMNSPDQVLRLTPQ